MRELKYLFFIISLSYLSTSCKRTKKSFFNAMQSNYCTDSLSPFLQGEFGGFGVKNNSILKNNKYYIEFSVGENSKIPFDGLMRYENDTIYYLNNDDLNANEQPIFIFNAKKFQSWYIEYKNGVTDSIMYMGKTYDQYYHDSIDYFMFNSINMIDPFGHSYMKYVALDTSGIKYITFENRMQMNTVLIKKHLKEVFTIYY